MGVLPWLFSASDSGSVKQIERPISSDDLVNQIQGDIQSIDAFKTACQHKDQLLENHNKGFEELKSKYHDSLATQNTLRAQKAKIEQEIKQIRQEVVTNRKAFNRQHNELQASAKALAQTQKTIAQRDTELKVTSQQLSTAQQQANEMYASNQKLTTKCHELVAARDDMRFELELMKCTAADHSGDAHDKQLQPDEPRYTVGSSKPHTLDQTTKTLLPPSPYAVVLVDGDGYYWSAQHFAQKKHPSGAHAAHAIKSEVQSHILAQSLPLQSKIITRVYSNIHCFRAPRFKDQFASQMEEFIESFTESTPLFDYIHAGRGKERADEKIKENFHLHITDPCCHTIFLALTHDNGFARLLEQYVCDPAARRKIVLVSSGRVASEIARLDLTLVEWPLVFAPQRPDPGDVKKTARHAANRAQIGNLSRNLMHAEVAASYMSHVKLPELGSPNRPGVLRRHTVAPAIAVRAEPALLTDVSSGQESEDTEFLSLDID